MGYRILHVAALPFPSNQGTQVYIRQLCENQVKQGHDIHLLTYWYGLTGYRPKQYKIHRLPDFPRFRSLRSGPAWKKVALDVRMIPAVDRLVKTLKPDIVHAHNYEALAAALVGNMGRRRLVYHAHTLLEPELPSYIKGKAFRTMAGITGLAADKFLPLLADVCVTISPYLREALIAHGVEGRKVFYMPPALYLDDFGSPQRKSKDGSGADFIYIGNLDSYQGIGEMLEGIGKLVRRQGDVKVKFVSDSNPDPYFSLALDLGIAANISFEPHGEFSKVVKKLRSSTVALAPRKIPGGFPMKLINYLHAKKPVIASVHGSGGLRHGREALVYDTVDDFTKCALDLISDDHLKNRLASAGYRFAKENFLWKKNLGILDFVYHKLLRAEI